MIEFTETHLKLSQAVCKALIAFASSDKTRADINGVGINQGNVCATDGHGIVRFQKHIGVPNAVDNRVFSLEYVKQQLKIAAAQKSDTVELDNATLVRTLSFPPVHHAETNNRKIHLPAATPYAFNAELFGRMALVQAACSPTKRNKPSDGTWQPAKLVSLSHPKQPCTFEVGSHSTPHPSVHFARVTLMPVDLNWPTGQDE